jgi:DnaJ family protein A protein 2
VVFILKASPHDSFERSGNDLLTNVTITLSEALLGFSRILIRHLDGRGVQVTTPPGKIIKPDDSIVVRGEGMPVYKRPDQKGDLYVIFAIEMPDKEWLKTVDQKVRPHKISHVYRSKIVNDFSPCNRPSHRYSPQKRRI